MTEALPIRFSIDGLFEAGDANAEFLVTKLEAWLNYRALCANWYADESLVVTISIELLPERLFLAKEVDQSQAWQSNENPTALYLHDQQQRHFECYLMLSNQQIDQAMQAPAKLEHTLQLRLAAIVNLFAKHYHLAAI